MTEVTVEHFNDLFPKIKEDLQNAKFIAVDTEFSALNISTCNNHSLFDTVFERYNKMKTTAANIIPVQIGVSAFHFDRDSNAYAASVYTFYIFPRAFSTVDTVFTCSSASIQFLCDHKFDFNKFVYSGLPFLNRAQEKEIRMQLKDQSLTELRSSSEHQLEHLLESQSKNILQWYYGAKDGDILELPDIMKKFRNNFDILYFFHKHLRSRLDGTLWTFEDAGMFKVKKVSTIEFRELSNQNSLDENLVMNLLGFTRVFRLLTELKKPIIGQNLLMDIFLMIHHFECPLPKSYKDFKSLAKKLFPIIYDTKCLSFELRRGIEPDRTWKNGSLEGLYLYFKDGHGRHLAKHSPLIESREEVSSYDHFHHAGWDSYCTGYIFIRMAHIFAQSQEPLKRKFMSTELLQAVSYMKNHLNVIRCSISHIKLDGDDPISTRPPCLIIESVKKDPVNINEVVNLLSTCGFIEIKPHSSRGRRAIVAVDNYTSAKKILEKYGNHKNFRIHQYNILKHSPIAKYVLLGGAVLTGGLIAWWAR